MKITTQKACCTVHSRSYQWVEPPVTSVTIELTSREASVLTHCIICHEYCAVSEERAALSAALERELRRCGVETA